jgi:hypothetical protein
MRTAKSGRRLLPSRIGDFWAKNRKARGIMASITRERHKGKLNGCRTIQFAGTGRKRQSLRLGKCSQKVAEAIKLRVERLNVATKFGVALNSETLRWLASIDEVLANKLARIGLIPKPQVRTLGAFIDAYLLRRTDLCEGTITALEQVRKKLVDYFGEGTLLSQISAGDADNFRL